MLEEVILSIVRDGDSVEPFIEHEMMLTADEMFKLKDLLDGIAKAGPDCIPTLLATLNRAT